MYSIEVQNVVKNFGQVRAVNGASFQVRTGEIFGLLGPNGAGKTTTIRMALDLFQPDSGTISILGGAMTEDKKRLIGYMPEERGLYQDIPVDRCILYLASLKGLSKTEAANRMEGYLERFDLADHRKKKVKELSRGMQQKAQIISTVIHEPELLIVDEPFSGLDPVNSQLVRDLMEELRNQGKTIVMSTHQMGQVEELCDSMVLLNQGRDVLFGHPEEIRRQFATGDLLVHASGSIPDVPGVIAQVPHNGMVRLNLGKNTKPADVLRALLEADVQIDKYELALPTLNEIFIRVVRGHDNDQAAST